MFDCEMLCWIQVCFFFIHEPQHMFIYITQFNFVELIFTAGSPAQKLVLCKMIMLYDTNKNTRKKHLGKEFHTYQLLYTHRRTFKPAIYCPG